MEQWIKDDLETMRSLAEEGLCDRCLGRMFGKKGTGMTNDLRGRMIRDALKETGNSPEAQNPCPVCEGLFGLLDRFAVAAADRIKEVESDNFLIGCRVEPAVIAKEKALWIKYGLENTEAIKTEFNREIGKLVYDIIGREVEFDSPQAVACVDTRFASVELDIAPIFIAGRYNKLSREIPQTVWPCRACHGKGCPRCNGLGKMYATSVQEEIGNIALKMSDGKEDFFHGMGREDIDARMLGTGRPFILEIADPKIRNIDLEELQKRANMSELAQFRDLKFVPRSYVKMYKSADPDKTYLAKVRAEDNINKERAIEVISSFKDVCLSQRTPQRVEHRRADLIRDRTIRSAEVKNIDDDSFDIILTTESGTYVKEFVSGDEGRTSPSLSGVLGVQCHVEALDVMDIDYQENTRD